MEGVQTIGGQVALLETGLGGTLWAGAHLMLFTNTLTPSPQTVIGDLTEPTTLAGYARKTVAWGVGGWDVADQVAEAVSTTTSEWVGDASTGVTVVGWGLASALTAGVLLACGTLDSPFALLADTDVLDLTARVRANGTADAVLAS